MKSIIEAENRYFAWSASGFVATKSDHTILTSSITGERLTTKWMFLATGTGNVTMSINGSEDGAVWFPVSGVSSFVLTSGQTRRQENTSDFFNQYRVTGTPADAQATVSCWFKRSS